VKELVRPDAPMSARTCLCPLGRIIASVRTRLCSCRCIGASARTHQPVYADASACPRGRVFLPSAWTVKTCPRVKMHPRDKHGRPDEMDVRMINFTVGRPFRHPWSLWTSRICKCCHLGQWGSFPSVSASGPCRMENADVDSEVLSLADSACPVSN
jgi:hypothetical protein